jgi:MFS family permease
VQGLINAFDIPARQAFLPHMIASPTDMTNGIALNSTMFNAARLVGPALAGALIALVGETWCFFIDGLSYIAVLWALNEIIVPLIPRDASHKDKRLLQSFAEGINYAYHFLPIRSALLLVAVLSFMGMPYTVLLPVYAKDVFGGGPNTLGLLTSSAGLGALVGAILLAKRESVTGIGRLIVIAGTAFALALVLFAYSRNLPLSIIFLFIAGYGMITQSASCNTILQTVVDPDKRGRVMSLYATAFAGMAPFGSLAAGALAKSIGTPTTLALCALSCALSTSYFALKLPKIREAAYARAA